MNKSTQLISVMAFALTVASVAQAGDAVGPGDREDRWVLGGGIATATNIYAGEDTYSTAFPNINFNGERFFVKAGSLNYSVKEWGQLSAGVTLTYDVGFLALEELYEDNAKLAGLKERDASVEGGIYINHSTDMGRLNFSLLSDVSNNHDGYSASLNYTFDLRAGGWYINPVLGLNWLDANKVNHHFGVSTAEATVTRLAYEGDATLNVFAGIRGRYEFSQHWDLNIRAGVTRYGSGITDSSIVDEDTGYYGALSLNYAF